MSSSCWTCSRDEAHGRFVPGQGGAGHHLQCTTIATDPNNVPVATFQHFILHEETKAKLAPQRNRVAETIGVSATFVFLFVLLGAFLERTGLGQLFERGQQGGQQGQQGQAGWCPTSGPGAEAVSMVLGWATRGRALAPWGPG